LLGRWHQWRRAFSHERGYARNAMFRDLDGDGDEFEAMQLRTIEAEISRLPADMQLALQHVARAECMGVEVIFSPRLRNAHERDSLIARAMAELERRLLHLGVI
jgi:hypothetical protein